MKKYIRSKVNGMIFDWSEALAKNPNVEVVEESEAYPERMIPEAFKDYKPKVEIKIPDEVVSPPNEAPIALREELTIRTKMKLPKNNKLGTKLSDISGLVKGDF